MVTNQASVDIPHAIEESVGFIVIDERHVKRGARLIIGQSRQQPGADPSEPNMVFRDLLVIPAGCIRTVKRLR